MGTGDLVGSILLGIYTVIFVATLFAFARAIWVSPPLWINGQGICCKGGVGALVRAFEYLSSAAGSRSIL